MIRNDEDIQDNKGKKKMLTNDIHSENEESEDSMIDSSQNSSILSDQ